MNKTYSKNHLALWLMNMCQLCTLNNYECPHEHIEECVKEVDNLVDKYYDLKGLDLIG